MRVGCKPELGWASRVVRGRRQWLERGLQAVCVGDRSVGMQPSGHNLLPAAARLSAKGHVRRWQSKTKKPKGVG